MSLNRCSVKNGRKKESCRINLTASLWSHSLEKQDSNSTVKWPSCEGSKTTIRRATPSFSSEVLRKMFWSDICNCCVRGQMRSYTESTCPDQPVLATKPPEQLMLENPILSMTAALVWPKEFLKYPQIQSRFFFSWHQAISKIYLPSSKIYLPFCLWKRQRGGSHLLPSWSPSAREDTLQHL